MKYKLLLLDIDGTLRPGSCEQIPKENAAAVRAVQKAGVKIAIATGRGRTGVGKGLLRDLKPDYWVCAGGAQLVDAKGNDLALHRLTAEEMYALVDFFEDYELPRLAVLLPAGVQRVDAALAARFVPRYEARLASLQAENTALHKHLAGAQIALAENDALRQWAGIERPAGRWQAARVVFRWHDHAKLAGVYPVGAAVCDEQGRFAGRITEAGADRCTLTFAGYLSPAAAGFAGEQAGLLQKNWRLTGLPLPTTLAAGTVVTTADGLWLGTLAGIPAPAADGLSAEAPLTDTADLGSQVFFIKM